MQSGLCTEESVGYQLSASPDILGVSSLKFGKPKLASIVCYFNVLYLGLLMMARSVGPSDA